MADIKQAAKWMQEGKKVRRRTPTTKEILDGIWRGKPVETMERHPTGMISPADKGRNDFFPFVVLGTESLLADDWEIAE